MKKKVSYTDHELISKVAEGDEKAFNRLFELYWDKIYSIAFVLTKSPVLSEELVQDILLKVWIQRNKLQSVERIDNYLFVVARNHIYNELRKKLVEQSFIEHLENHFVQTCMEPEQQIIHKEIKQLIHKAVEQLPNQQRAVFELSRSEGYNNKTIAEKLGISPLTVKSHMNKALHFIRNYLHLHSDF